MTDCERHLNSRAMDDYSDTASCQLLTHASHRLRTVSIRNDLLILIRSGSKTLLSQRAPVTIASGNALILACGSQWDVINDPAPRAPYRASLLQFGDHAIKDFNDRYAAAFSVRTLDDCLHMPIDAELEEAVARASAIISATASSASLRHHRVMEVLLLLAERGCLIKPRQQLSWSDRAQRLIGQRPHAEWTAEHLAQAFHVSVSTLRRRLADCNTSAAEMVREVRMEAALLLLQSTRLPVGEVAQRCGYDSHSRFSAAFRSRYGFLPSHLRESGMPAGADSADSINSPDLHNHN